MVISKRSITSIPEEELTNLLHKMLLIRRFEEKAAEMYARGKIKGFLHLYVGQEAVSVGVIPLLRDDDYIYSHYREHGHALTRGIEPRRIMAELFGKLTGVSRGLGGSMHLFDLSKRFMGGYAIVGGQLPLACGTALACKRLGKGNVTLAILGDGAVNEGAFHESLNLAAVWRLPVLFLCENNYYGMGTAMSKVSATTEIHKRAEVYGIRSQQVDGMDIVAVRKAAEQALQLIRAGEGPFFLEATTYRFRGHSMADPELYRDKTEIQHWRESDPIPKFTEAILRSGQMTQEEIDALQQSVEEEIEEAVRFAEESPFPSNEALMSHIYAPSPVTTSSETSPPGPLSASGEGSKETIGDSPENHEAATLMAQMAIRDALREAIRERMLADDRVLLIGEDVGAYGGSYSVSKGLLQEFGPDRIIDTPISELAFVGAGIGAAMAGLRPIVEIMTINFSFLAMDQIINHASKIHFMFGGQVSVPLVIRMASGAGLSVGAQHSHSLEGWFAHVPGLKVACPSNPADAKGLLRTALMDENPVIFIENTATYGLRGEVPDGDYSVPFGQADIVRSGTDVTIIGYSGSMQQANRAAELLAQEDIEAEVIDLRTLRPLDATTIVESVKKTSRAVVVEHAWRFGGFGAEIAALIQEHAFDYLDAPVARVAGLEVPMPYSFDLEKAALPNEHQVVEAVRAMF